MSSEQPIAVITAQAPSAEPKVIQVPIAPAPTENPQTIAAAKEAARAAALAELDIDPELGAPAPAEPSPAAPAPVAEALPATPAEPAPNEGQSYWKEVTQLRRENRELSKRLKEQGDGAISLEALRQYDPGKLVRALNWDESTLINVLTGQGAAPQAQPAQPQVLTREDIEQIARAAARTEIQPIQRQLTMGEIAQVVARAPEQYEMILQDPQQNLQLVIDTANELGRPANDPEVLGYIEGILVEHHQKQLEGLRGTKKLHRYFMPAVPVSTSVETVAPAPAIAGPNGNTPIPRPLTKSEIRAQCLDLMED